MEEHFFQITLCQAQSKKQKLKHVRALLTKKFFKKNYLPLKEDLFTTNVIMQDKEGLCFYGISFLFVNLLI